jgi:hypothetical protein
LEDTAAAQVGSGVSYTAEDARGLFWGWHPDFESTAVAELVTSRDGQHAWTVRVCKHKETGEHWAASAGVSAGFKASVKPTIPPFRVEPRSVLATMIGWYEIAPDGTVCETPVIVCGPPVIIEGVAELDVNAGAETAWPVKSVLEVLFKAAGVLLDDHNYDRHGWERIEYARRAAREYIEGREPGVDDVWMKTPVSITASHRAHGVPFPTLDGEIADIAAKQRETALARVAELQAEVLRLRARVCVAAEDVELFGITDGKAKRYLLERGWTLGHHYRGGGPDRDPLNLVTLCLDGDAVAALAQDDSLCQAESIAFICWWIAKKQNRSTWDVLEEMAAEEMPW